MHPAAKHMPRNGAADERRRNIVEEARKHGDDAEQGQSACPVIGQEARHLVRNPAFLKMPGEQRKAHEQAEQVGKNDPLMLEMADEPRQARAEFEAGKDQLINRDGGKPGHRHLQRVVVEQRNTKQRQPEQDEVDRNARQKI